MRILGVYFAFCITFVLFLHIDESLSSEPFNDSITILAKVNGEKITLEQLNLSIDALPGEYQEVARKSLSQMMLQQLIDLKILSSLAEDSGINQTSQYRLELEFLVDQLKREHFLRNLFSSEVTDENIMNRYKNLISQMDGNKEVRARHILVESEEEAILIKERLDSGEDFVELASKESIGPTAGRGGDLGFFSRESMVKEFSDVAFSLTVGDISNPVNTKFGWHIILIEDAREIEIPPFATVESEIREELNRMALSRALVDARENSDIEIMNVDLDSLMYDKKN